MKKYVALFLALLMALSAFSAVSEEKPVVTIGKEMDTNGIALLEGQSAEKNNYYLDYAQLYAGCEVEYTWFLADDSQKISLAVANGQMPDAMIVDETTYNMLLAADMLMDITDVFNEVAPGTILESVFDIFPASYNAATVSGRLMAIPDTLQQNVHAITWIRQDWLDNLGLDAPSTLDELTEVILAFVNDDPDGNGLDDTIGLPVYEDVFGTYNQMGDLSYIASQFGAYPRTWYTQEDGTVVYGSVTKETRDALEYLQGMYADGAIDQEFAVRDFKEMIVSGKCGLVTGNWSISSGALQQSHAYDGADRVPLLCPVDENGTYYTMYRKPSNNYVVINKACENPAEVLKLIIGSYNFHWYVDLDQEWTEKRDVYSNIGASWYLMPLSIQLERSLVVKQRYEAFARYLETGETEGNPADVQGFIDAYINYLSDNTALTGWARYKGMYFGGSVELSENNDYLEPCFFGTTDSMKQYWTSLKTMEDEIFVKIIMGEADISEFDEFVDNWYKLGGAEITEEVQQYVDSH